MGHHQHRGQIVSRLINLSQMLALQAIQPAAGLVHQLWNRLESAAIGAFQLQLIGSLSPEAVGLGKALFHLASQQAAPGVQIHLQQVVVTLGAEPTPWASSSWAAVLAARLRGSCRRHRGEGQPALRQ